MPLRREGTHGEVVVVLAERTAELNRDWKVSFPAKSILNATMFAKCLPSKEKYAF
jgi:hypothetical protein